MKHNLHITIGIPVHNEESNIANLLRLLLTQNQDNYTLDQILIINDGSTDKTTTIVRSISGANPKVVLIDDHTRRGVRFRTQQLLDLCKSDILIFFDGDTIPKDKNILRNIVTVFSNPEINLATANLQPINPESLFESALFNWRSLWSDVTHAWMHGDNVYNFRGVGLAIRKSFAEKIKIPKNLTGASSHYIYLYAKSKSVKTAFCFDGVIYYRLAKTLKDYSLQLNRGQNDGSILKSKFSTIYNQEYKIPKIILIWALLKGMVLKPLRTIVAIFFNLWISTVKRDMNPSDHEGVWEIATSTKNTLSIKEQ